MSKIYEIDPDADTVVTVRPLVEGFAPWPAEDHDKSSAASSSLLRPTTDVRIKASAKHLSLASSRFRDILAQAVTAASPLQTSYKPLIASLDNNDTKPNSLWRKETAPPSPPLSDYGGSSPSQTSEADGRIHVVLEGLDADAVITVLNIVHGRGGKDRVPKAISLEALARIAVVIDKFKLQHAVDIYADRWVDALGHPSARNSPRELTLWIYIAYVFQHDNIFQEATKLAAVQLTGPLPALANLPLRAKIVRDLDAQRQAVIEGALQIIRDTINTLIVDEDIGDGEDQKGVINSDTFLLGALLRTLHRQKVFWPHLAAPYTGISVTAITSAAHDVQTQAWQMAFRLGDLTRYNKSNNALRLTPQLDTLRARAAGLQLRSELGYNLY
ncbi:MAG: hypothetical protein SEPTF4163_003504 [Sporothrix epigloea]